MKCMDISFGCVVVLLFLIKKNLASSLSWFTLGLPTSD